MIRRVVLKRALDSRHASLLAHSLLFSLSFRRNAVSSAISEEDAETIIFPRECPGISYGLNWALASKGVIVKDKAFLNLKSSELHHRGATIVESLSGLPVYVQGKALGVQVSKVHFSRLLKQVTNHISSIPSVFVHDGAIGSFPKCDAKVRVISDCPSAILSLSNVLCRIPTRAISHDSCHLTVYVAKSISPSVGDAIGRKFEGNDGFIAYSIEHPSLILCGKAFSDTNGIKEALVALARPIISAQGGLPLSAKLLSTEDSVILLFAPEDITQSLDSLLPADGGVILSDHGVATFFNTGNSAAPNLVKLPAAVVLVTSDSLGVIPSLSKLSPGQSAYHFLAGYQDGFFFPAYNTEHSFTDPLELAKTLLSKLKDNDISSFLINTRDGEKHITGKDLDKLVKSTLSKNLPPFEPNGGDVEGRIKDFLSNKFQEIPQELLF